MPVRSEAYDVKNSVKVAVVDMRIGFDWEKAIGRATIFETATSRKRFKNARSANGFFYARFVAFWMSRISQVCVVDHNCGDGDASEYLSFMK